MKRAELEVALSENTPLGEAYVPFITSRIPKNMTLLSLTVKQAACVPHISAPAVSVVTDLQNTQYIHKHMLKIQMSREYNWLQIHKVLTKTTQPLDLTLGECHVN